jgi:hypothetical protein
VARQGETHDVAVGFKHRERNRRWAFDWVTTRCATRGDGFAETDAGGLQCRVLGAVDYRPRVHDLIQSIEGMQAKESARATSRRRGD